MMKFSLAICGLIWVLFIQPAVCLARVEISPRLVLREEFNDNIFLEAANQDADFITTALPGLGIALDNNPFRLSLDYSLELRKYLDNSAEDETNIRDVQRGLAMAQLLPGREVSFDLIQEFSRVPIDARLPSTEGNTRVNKTNLSHTVVRPRWHHRLTRTFELFLDYQYENWNYRSPLGDDFEGQGARLGVIKRISPRLDLLVGGSGGTYDARLTLDYDLATAYAGVSTRVTPTLRVDAVAGQAWVDFDGIPNDQALIGDVVVQWQLGNNYSVGCGYSEDFRHAADQGLFRHKLARALVGWNLKTDRYVGEGIYSWRRNYPERGEDLLSRLLSGESGNRSYWELSLYALRDTFYSVEREDREAGVALTTRLQLADSWDLALGGRLSELKFRPGAEKVSRYAADIGIDYLLRSLTLALHYFYWQDDSDNDLHDFQNNVVYLEAGWQF